MIEPIIIVCLSVFVVIILLAVEMYFEELAEPARFYKETKEGKEIMGNAFDRVREEGRNEGREDGLREGILKSAKIMLKRGIIEFDKIPDLFPELTESDITAIKAEMILPS